MYSYEEIIGYLIDEGNTKLNIPLEIKLKEIIDKIDVEQLSQLLMDEEIIEYNKIGKTENNKVISGTYFFKH